MPGTEVAEDYSTKRLRLTSTSTSANPAACLVWLKVTNAGPPFQAP
jgi:hypothetical protein